MVYNVRCTVFSKTWNSGVLALHSKVYTNILYYTLTY